MSRTKNSNKYFPMVTIIYDLSLILVVCVCFFKCETEYNFQICYLLKL